MSSESLIAPAPVTLTKDDIVGNALVELLDHRQSAAPVIDRQGRYLGMFGARDVIAALLPKGATAGGMLDDISFVSEQLADIRARLSTLLDHRVGRHVDTSLPAVHPDTPMAETLLLLYRSRSVLAAVDRKTKLLIGVVSGSDALSRIVGPG